MQAKIRAGRGRMELIRYTGNNIGGTPGLPEGAGHTRGHPYMPGVSGYIGGPRSLPGVHKQTQVPR